MLQTCIGDTLLDQKNTHTHKKWLLKFLRVFFPKQPEHASKKKPFSVRAVDVASGLNQIPRKLSECWIQLCILRKTPPSWTEREQVSSKHRAFWAPTLYRNELRKILICIDKPFLINKEWHLRGQSQELWRTMDGYHSQRAAQNNRWM